MENSKYLNIEAKILNFGSEIEGIKGIVLNVSGITLYSKIFEGESIDEKLLKEAMKAARKATKKATVEAGLSELVRKKLREELISMGGKTEINLTLKDLEKMRQDEE